MPAYCSIPSPEYLPFIRENVVKRCENYFSDSALMLERNFRRFIRLYAQEEFNKLPRDIRYYPLIEECYNRIFYGRAKRPESCPGNCIIQD